LGRTLVSDAAAKTVTAGGWAGLPPASVVCVPLPSLLPQPAASVAAASTAPYLSGRDRILALY
jgi:hypothetical protein